MTYTAGFSKPNTLEKLMVRMVAMKRADNYPDFYKKKVLWLYKDIFMLILEFGGPHMLLRLMWAAISSHGL
jgi:hypothetical protein